MFDLRFHPDQHSREVARGTITIGDFSETFEAMLGRWSAQDYRSSWLRAAERFSSTGDANFIADTGSPGNGLMIWPCRREGDEAVLKNVYISPENARQLASLAAAEALPVGYAEEGISIWRVAAIEVLAFEARLRGATN